LAIDRTCQHAHGGICQAGRRVAFEVKWRSCLQDVSVKVLLEASDTHITLLAEVFLVRQVK
jgi:hypothetical protein